MLICDEDEINKSTVKTQLWDFSNVSCTYGAKTNLSLPSSIRLLIVGFMLAFSAFKLNSPQSIEMMMPTIDE